jgi:histone H3/H4
MIYLFQKVCIRSPGTLNMLVQPSNLSSMYSPKAKARRDRQIAKILLAATVQKIITEILPPSDGQVFARDARDLLIECCVEFVTLISTEANDISEKEAKKTIAVDHIEKALTELGFADYVPEVLAVADEFKDQQKVRMGFRMSLRHACLIIGGYRLEKSGSTRWRQVV